MFVHFCNFVNIVFGLGFNVYSWLGYQKKKNLFLKDCKGQL
jgi:hypothetical protein